MEAIVTLVHIVGAVVLILLVLLQQGKGSGMGSAFGGGGSQTTFGTSGGSIFGKATAVAAVVFMVTSLSLAYISGRGATSLMRGPAPVEQGVAPLEDLPQNEDGLTTDESAPEGTTSETE